MNDPNRARSLVPIVLPPDEGRTYPCGAMRAVFKADGVETNDTYSISEWTLEPGCTGPGAHAHDLNDDIFYVLEGTVTFILDGSRIDAPTGSFIRVPQGVEHDYFNESAHRARLLNIYIPGGFEAEMPAIVEWFAANPD